MVRAHLSDRKRRRRRERRQRERRQRERGRERERERERGWRGGQGGHMSAAIARERKCASRVETPSRGPPLELLMAMPSAARAGQARRRAASLQQSGRPPRERAGGRYVSDRVRWVGWQSQTETEGERERERERERDAETVREACDESGMRDARSGLARVCCAVPCLGQRSAPHQHHDPAHAPCAPTRRAPRPSHSTTCDARHRLHPRSTCTCDM